MPIIFQNNDPINNQFERTHTKVKSHCKPITHYNLFNTQFIIKLINSIKLVDMIKAKKLIENEYID